MTPALILALVLLLLGLGAGGMTWYRVAWDAGGRDLEAIVDGEVHKLHRGGRDDFAVVVGVWHDGRAWTKGYGRTSSTDPAAPTSATVFQIGSVTKVFTASLLHLLSLERRVSGDWTIAQVLGPSVPLADAVSGITLEQLATHTSGLPRLPKFLERDLPMEHGKEAVMQDPYSLIRLDTVLAYLQDAPEARPPGRFAYSNYGMGLLAHLLERATGEGYESLLRRHILDPLQMQHTAITLDAAMQARLAQGHDMKGRPVPPWGFQSLGGAGALYSTVDDLMRFARAGLDGGPGLPQMLQATHAPRHDGKTGLGWIQPTFLDRMLGNRTLVWHDGGTLGYASYICVDRGSRTAIVILCAQGTGAALSGTVLHRKLRNLQAGLQATPQDEDPP